VTTREGGDDTDTAEVAEHQLSVATVGSMAAGFTGRRPNTGTDVIATCACGWQSPYVDGSRGARRAFTKHLRRVARVGVDLGDAPSPDDRRRVRQRHAQ
jgi:hypothetical protein